MSRPSKVLLVIDIQRGAFDGVRCPIVDSPERLIQNASALIDAAHAAGSPVVFVQHCDGVGQPFEEGSAHWQLHESLVPAPGDWMLKKYASSSFEGTELDAQLKAKQLHELILCGLQSEFCVSNTARSALRLGYTVRIAQDGHGTWVSQGKAAEEIRRDVNSALASLGAFVTTTSDLALELRRARE